MEIAGVNCKYVVTVIADSHRGPLPTPQLHGLQLEETF